MIKIIVADGLIFILLCAAITLIVWALRPGKQKKKHSNGINLKKPKL